MVRIEERATTGVSSLTDRRLNNLIGRLESGKEKSVRRDNGFLYAPFSGVMHYVRSSAESLLILARSEQYRRRTGKWPSSYSLVMPRPTWDDYLHSY